MFIVRYFYPKRGACAILALLALVASAGFAQSRKKKDSGPRALALVELPADGKSRARIIPIAILNNGRFWDATIYLADPRPLALDPGNVYEVERSGEPVGTVSVSEARQLNDRWIGIGEYQAKSAKPPKESKPVEWHASDEDERPILRKSPSPGASPDKSKPDSKPDSQAKTAASIPDPSDDPNRPVLRRGKPKPQPESDDFGATAPDGTSKIAPLAPFTAKETLAAISDAGGPEPHSFAYAWSAAEQAKLTKAVEEIAAGEAARYAKGIPALPFSPGSGFEQVSIRAFDVDNSNNPVVVFTARIPAVVVLPGRAKSAQPLPANSGFFVTVVGQTDLYGQMRKLFSLVTDSRHLDAFPRLELIDAVDGEGISRGNLLFRAHGRSSSSYQLYHVGPDSLRKLFDSSGG